MDIKIKIKAKKDGQMEDGDFFCYKDSIYDGILLEDDEFFDDPNEKYWYFIEDELDLGPDAKHYSDWHSMDKEFFDEYFEIIKEK